ncbi:unnamed protein product [Bursaphelenchus xylophilus]|uniref:(pine wood nematode) hypothetical protein n=1 Tax=Bursaphelenchus xylophilus TaxID=6326 RepID=A0A1I7SVC2_BURXY|nr:unnamed protein product [Bursaphelenchus xylophilus]CAG9101215.1 unnamed protein product [Bursaphelenchus xylophilus]
MISCDVVIFVGTFGFAMCITNLWIPIMVSAIILSIVMLSYVVLYGCLFRAHLWNKQRFFRSKIHIKTYTLSQRFQLSENVRTVSLILNSAMYAAVGGGITAAQIFLMLAFSKNSQVMTFLLPILNVTQPLGISLIFLPAAVSQILVIPAWKQRTIQLLNSLSRIRGIGKVLDTVKTKEERIMDVCIVKRKLDERRVHEQELYFEMFKSAWQ